MVIKTVLPIDTELSYKQNYLRCFCISCHHEIESCFQVT